MARIKYDGALVDALVAGKADNHPIGAWLFGGMGLDALSDTDAATAIEAAQRMGKADRLAEAKADGGSKAVRKLAGAALHKLRSTGQDVPLPVVGGAKWSLGAEARESLPPAAVLGPPESDGYVPFVFVSHGDEEACLAAGLAGAGRGFRDVEHGHMGRSDARKVVRDVGRDHQMVEVPFHEGLAIVERAFDLGGGKRPHGWGHMLDHVDDAVKTSARVLDPLRHLPTELDRDALYQIEPLMTGDHRVVLALDEEIAHRGAIGCLEIISSQLDLSPEHKKERISEIIDGCADQAVDGIYRENWAFALDTVAYLAHKTDQPERMAVARHTALALRAGLAGHDIPFVVDWVDQQLRTLIELAQGVAGGGQTPPMPLQG